MRAGLGGNQLNIDPERGAETPYISFECVAYTQFLADFLHILGPPAVRCGLLFEVRMIGIAPGATGTMIGNRANCPRCGSREADIIDGIYSAFQDRLDIALAPTVSAQAREALLALISLIPSFL
jgi:hypothetical protein